MREIVLFKFISTASVDAFQVLVLFDMLKSACQIIVMSIISLLWTLQGFCMFAIQWVIFTVLIIFLVSCLSFPPEIYHNCKMRNFTVFSNTKIKQIIWEKFSFLAQRLWSFWRKSLNFILKVPIAVGVFYTEDWQRSFYVAQISCFRIFRKKAYNLAS